MLEMRAYLLGFVIFNRTRVSFALTDAKFREDIENLATLDFQLAREIVNSNLAHPPLFRICYPKPFSRSWLPLGIGWLRCRPYSRFSLFPRNGAHWAGNGVEKRGAFKRRPLPFPHLFPERGPPRSLPRSHRRLRL